MADESIVDEVRRARQEIAAKHGHDLGRIVKAMRAAQKKGGRKVVSLERKRARTASRTR